MARDIAPFSLGNQVSLLKQVTIPRLELTAAVISVRMDRLLRQELQVPLQQSVFCYGQHNCA